MRGPFGGGGHTSRIYCYSGSRSLALLLYSPSRSCYYSALALARAADAGARAAAATRVAALALVHVAPPGAAAPAAICYCVPRRSPADLDHCFSVTSARAP